MDFREYVGSNARVMAPKTLNRLIIALYVPGINVVFSLMGGTGSAFVCYMLPAAFAWKLDVPEVRGLWGKAACLALFYAVDWLREALDAFRRQTVACNM